jgi:D-3-phosphoglycerate dehydrogenase
MINAESLKKMKKGVRLVNCARGELIEEAALAAALKDGQVGAAALDVFCNEPLKDSLFQKMDNVVLTPHIAGSTNEAQEAVGQQIALQVKEYLKHGVIQNAVNVPSVSEDEYAKMRPYITLAERLGSFLAQISGNSVEHIAISYTGHITEWKTELIRNAAIKGILNVHVEEKANLVNAASLASERGLTVSEERKPKASTGGAGSVLKISITTPEEEHVVKGAVLRENTPRLLHVDGIDVEAPLEQNLIYMRNQEVPHAAIAVVHVDGEVPEAVVSELRGVPAVQQAKAVRLD